VSERLAVRKTHKMLIGGAFVRSESGRTQPFGLEGGDRVWVPAATRKDVRDAVTAARGAFEGWSGRTGYNRGQILYRCAEVAEERRAALVAELAAQGARRADADVCAAIDRLVHYAGWPDKIHQVAGTVNGVAGDYFNFTLPEPTGVVAIVAPEERSLCALVSRIAPALAGGNTVVAVVPAGAPLSGLTLGEVLMTGDAPAGVVNLLSGSVDELVPALASHMDVNAIDLGAVSGELRVAAERAAAGNLKRLVRGADVDWTSPGAQGQREVLAFMELKTVWHSMGL
jgi:acyl-CoA reductase-like NAD-dependent aldehyde dehydrogenase